MREKIIEKLGTIFYLGLFPFLFFAIFAGMFFYFLDIPVWRTIQSGGNKIPIVSMFIPDSNTAQAEDTESKDYWKRKFERSRNKVKEKDQKIKELTSLLDSKRESINDLKKNNEELQKQLETKQFEDFHKQMEQVAEIYENMTPSKAAGILQTMPLEDASQIILFIEQDLQSSILGKMKDAKKAGQITMILKEISIITEYDEISLKKHLHEQAANITANLK